MSKADHPSQQPETPMRHVHTIPVPDGMDPLDAFEEIRIFGRLAEGREVEEDGTGGCWANIECDGNCGMNRASKEHRRQVASAVNKMLAARGGSAFRITAGQRRAILDQHRQAKRPRWFRRLLRWGGR